MGDEVGAGSPAEHSPAAAQRGRPPPAVQCLQMAGKAERRVALLSVLPYTTPTNTNFRAST